jgi:hypothetical protein
LNIIPPSVKPFIECDILILGSQVYATNTRTNKGILISDPAYTYEANKTKQNNSKNVLSSIPYLEFEPLRYFFIILR